jgi:hypothetical protein
LPSVNAVRSPVVGAKVRFVSSKDVGVREYERGNTLLRNGGGQLFHSAAVEIGGCVYVAGVNGWHGSGYEWHLWPKSRGWSRNEGNIGSPLLVEHHYNPPRVGPMAVLGPPEVRPAAENS